MINVYITYKDESEIKSFKDVDGISFNFIDSLSKKGKKEAWKLKSHWGAKLDPFAIIMNGETPIKAFYSEAQDVINDLALYLEENEDKFEYKESE